MRIKMKEEYEASEIEIVEFEESDIITTSTNNNTGFDDEGI